MNFLRILTLVAIALPGRLTCGAAPAGIAHGVDVTDPISGLHWLRLTDRVHPAAPPKLIQGRTAGLRSGHNAGSTRHAPCVRAGDRVTLRREDEGAAQMSLEATALGSGATGDRVRARISLTGALVEIKISGPGVGILSREASAWR